MSEGDNATPDEKKPADEEQLTQKVTISHRRSPSFVRHSPDDFFFRPLDKAAGYGALFTFVYEDRHVSSETLTITPGEMEGGDQYVGVSVNETAVKLQLCEISIPVEVAFRMRHALDIYIGKLPKEVREEYENAIIKTRGS